MQDSKRSITWSVSTNPDGSLIHKDTGIELSYLFWEAVASPHTPPPSPRSDPVHEAQLPLNVTEVFDPANSSLSPETPTAVLLPLEQLLPYLDHVLQRLTLHTAARNDFITYWLPKLSQQPYVALRFLPQAVYERAAELEVQPVPDVMTRVFMLFRGVRAEDVDAWANARKRVTQIDWVDIVGIMPEAHDRSVFRVLEWGAMEVC